MNLPQYRCHKVVRAMTIGAIDVDSGRLDLDVIDLGNDELVFPSVPVGKEWIARHKPEVGGYYVVYEDGYQSYLPAKAFEDGYTRV